MVKIRLKQTGKRGQKSYRIVVQNSTKWRDGATIDELGTYNPLTEQATVTIDVDKYNYWLSKGAQPTATIKNIYKNIVTKSV